MVEDAVMDLPPAANEIALKANQGDIFMDEARFLVVVCGRRFGKTTTLLLKLFKRACKRPGMYAYCAPTYKQGKLIAWKILKAIIPLNYRHGRPNESELSIRLRNGAEIRIFGMDNAENLYGVKLYGGILDEYDQMDPQLVKDVIRPAVSDTGGPLWYCGTPDASRGNLKALFNEVRTEKKQGKRLNWNTYKFKSIDGGYIPEEEINEAREELDERTYRQQYEATFESQDGKVYYAFDFDVHAQMSAEYMPGLAIRMFWDFNVDPFCVGFAQVHNVMDPLRSSKVLYQKIRVFDEMVIRNSNTPEMCREFLRKPWLQNNKAPLYVYGDASGKSRSTKASLSDYQMIQDILAPKFPQGFQLRVKDANPEVKDRTASVNSMLKSFDGTVRTEINPRCKWLLQDLMDVSRKPGTNDLDKSNPDRTHSTDGLGYFVDYEFSIVKGYLQ